MSLIAQRRSLSSTPMSEQSKVKISSKIMAQAPNILRDLASEYADFICYEDWSVL